MKKRIAALLLTLTMLVTFMPAMTFAAFADEVEATKPTVTIHYDNGQEDSVVEATASLLYDGYYYILLPKNPAKTGYTFARWEGSNFSLAWGAYRWYITADAEMTATWTADTHWVNFVDAENGYSEWVQETYDSKYVFPSEIPAKEGYYLSWYDAETGGNKIDSNTVVKITDNSQVLYARWSQIPTPAPVEPSEVEEFKSYKETLKAACDAEVKADDTDVTKALVEEAKKAIDAATYDVNLTLAENKAVLDKLVVDVKAKIEAQRLSEATAAQVAEVKVVEKSVKALKNGKIYVTFKTAKVDGNRITKYQIYRKAGKKGTYKAFRTVTAKKATRVYKNTKKIKKGKRYYYKVRGVVTLANGEKAFTQYSNVKSAKAKAKRK